MSYVMWICIGCLAFLAILFIIPVDHEIRYNTQCFEEMNTTCVFVKNGLGFEIQKMTIGYYCLSHPKSTYCYGMYEQVTKPIGGYQINLSNITFTPN